MLRIIVEGGAAAPRLLDEAAFAREIKRLEVVGFAGAPAGATTVEALDADGQVRWRAFYADYAGLSDLVEQLLHERQLHGNAGASSGKE